MAKTLTMTPVEELMVRLFHAPRILVVEDSAMAETLLHSTYNCVVDSTKNWRDVVKLLMTRKYDLALLDLSLLGSAADVVLKALQRHCPATPIVVTKAGKEALDQLSSRMGPVTLFTAALTLSTLERLFRMFKIKARTQEMEHYCQQLQRVTATG